MPVSHPSRARSLGRWAPVLVWMGVIFALSSQSSFPRMGNETLDVVLRKTAHLAEYAILAGLICRALPRTAAYNVSLWSVAIALAYAASDELHQSLVPQRTSSPLDVGVDLIGAMAGAGAWAAWGSGPALRRVPNPLRRTVGNQQDIDAPS